MSKFLTAATVLVLAAASFSQVLEEPKPPTEEQLKLKENAVAFLRETVAETGALRTLENRISFSSELAGLMWFHDEREARAMFQGIIIDFRQLIGNYDAQLNTLGAAEEGSDLMGGMSFLMPNRSERSRVMGDLSKALSVRRQIAVAISEHDPVLAYTFFDDTAQVVSNPEARKQLIGGDPAIESQLLQKIASKDPAKALEAGRNSLKRGFNYQMAKALKSLYERDPVKGAALAEDVTSYLKGQSLDSVDISSLRIAIEAGDANLKAIANDRGKVPMFSRQALRELADLMGQAMLRSDKYEEYNISAAMPLLEKWAPSRALQVRTKTGVKKATAPAPPPPIAIRDSSEALSPPVPRAAVGVPSGMPVPGGEKAEADPSALLANAGKEMSPEERQKMVAASRRIIDGMKTRDEKIIALSLLAKQTAALGDKELAVEIMQDAERLVSPSPKTYLDFMHSWMLASGYAHVEPARSFPILEESVFRLNDTLSGFIRVAEFIDVNGEIVEEGEVQLGALGGEMTGQALKMLSIADTTLYTLAKADFEKTKALTSRFDRTEVRILAKLLVLRAVLGERPELGQLITTLEENFDLPADEEQ